MRFSAMLTACTHSSAAVQVDRALTHASSAPFTMSGHFFPTVKQSFFAWSAITRRATWERRFEPHPQLKRMAQTHTRMVSAVSERRGGRIIGTPYAESKLHQQSVRGPGVRGQHRRIPAFAGTETGEGLASSASIAPHRPSVRAPHKSSVTLLSPTSPRSIPDDQRREPTSHSNIHHWGRAGYKSPQAAREVGRGLGVSTPQAAAPTVAQA